MPSRREFLSTILKSSGYAVTASYLGGLAGSERPSRDAAKPNVLFIAIDDLNDWVGCLGGHPDVKTPNMDRLAKRGVLFTHAYCSAPACNPSRASLLTGILPSTSGVYHNDQPWRPVMPKAVTLPQHFMAHGYHVVGGGKIFHGGYPDPASWHEYVKQGPDPMPPIRPLNGIRFALFRRVSAAMRRAARHFFSFLPRDRRLFRPGKITSSSRLLLSLI